MIHIFNRKELVTTLSMSELEKIRDVLALSNIDYCLKTGNLARNVPYSAGTRSRSGSIGIRGDAMYQYIVYVKAADYERARFLIGR